MSIVVTGASGFIGSTLVPMLAAHADVVAIDRRLPQRILPAVTTLTGELTQPSDEILDALHEADAVIHLAGCAGVRDCDPDVELRRERDNVTATRMVLTATSRSTPVLVTSSSSVYGGARPSHGPGQHPDSIAPLRPSREDDPLRPRGGYAASKVAAERVCQQHAHTGRAVLVVRPFTVLGEGQRDDMALARWAGQAREHGCVTVLGSPARTRDFTDIRMVTQTLTRLLYAGATGTINLGTGAGHSLAELSRAVGRAVGVPEPRLDIIDAPDVEVTHTLADTTRLESVVGPVPPTDLDDVARRAIASLDASAYATGVALGRPGSTEGSGHACRPVESINP